MAIVMMIIMASSAMAQIVQPKKETTNAKVVVKNGQERLVLKDQIELNVDTNIWSTLDSLTTAPWGGKGVQLKDSQGYNVLAQKSRINDQIGLMFTSGAKCVVLTKEEFDKLR